MWKGRLTVTEADTAIRVFLHIYSHGPVRENVTCGAGFNELVIGEQTNRQC